MVFLVVTVSVVVNVLVVVTDEMAKGAVVMKVLAVVVVTL